jgi:hypothetical protein
MKLLSSTCVLFALGLAATGCATDTPPTIDETRGALRVSGYATEAGGAVVDVATLDGEPIAAVACDPALRRITLSSPVDPTAMGAYDLPTEAAGCELAYTAEFALIASRNLMSLVNQEVALDSAGCDGIGGNSICCARHDACYAANDCSAWSWLTTGLVWSITACGRCNNAVVYCLAAEALQ